MNGPSADLGPQGSGGGDTGYFVYLRRTDGSLPIRLGEGQPAALSPDGRWALGWTAPTAAGTDEPDLVVYPTGAGEIRHLPRTGIASAGCCLIFPDGKRFTYSGVEKGRERPRVWIRDIEGGKLTPLTPEGYGGGPISPDGKTVLVGSPEYPSPETKWFLCSVEGGQLTQVEGLSGTEHVSRFSADGRSLYLVGPREIPRKIYRFDLATQRRELVREIRPADLAGISDIAVYPSARDDAYVYKYNRRLADLYLVDGLR
jgi:Tol biopolymer transport system component